MPSRLVALDEGPDIALDRAMVVVGRHPQCDARLDSIRVSRRHCCMTEDDNGDVVVRDLGSTNGIRINGQRVEQGRLRPGDELSIAHIRYRLEGDPVSRPEMTLADGGSHKEVADGHAYPFKVAQFSVPAHNKNEHEHEHEPEPSPPVVDERDENPLAAAVRELLPAGVAEKCRIQVIVQMPPQAEVAESPESCRPDSSP
jgi:FHA domain-containing protein